MKQWEFFIGFFLVGGLVSCGLDDEYFSNHRTEEHELNPEDFDPAVKEKVSFSSNGETIHGIFIEALNPDEDSQTILYFHGNDKDMDNYWHRLDWLYPFDVNIFIFNYQGYGRSTGSPSISALKQNSLDAYEYLSNRDDVNEEAMIFYGFSFGAPFAAHVAQERSQPQAMIFESPMASTDHIIRGNLKMSVPGSFFFNETFGAVSSLKELDMPLLIFHSEDDEKVSYSDNALPLYDAATEPKHLVTVQDSRHSDIPEEIGVETYQNEIEDFLISVGVWEE